MVGVLLADRQAPSLKGLSVQLRLGAVRAHLADRRGGAASDEDVGRRAPQRGMLGAAGDATVDEALETLDDVGAIGHDADGHVSRGDTEGHHRRLELRLGDALVIARQRARDDGRGGESIPLTVAGQVEGQRRPPRAQQQWVVGMVAARAVGEHVEEALVAGHTPRGGPPHQRPRRAFGGPRNVLDPRQRNKASVPEGRVSAAVAQSLLQGGLGYDRLRDIEGGSPWATVVAM